MKNNAMKSCISILNISSLLRGDWAMMKVSYPEPLFVVISICLFGLQGCVKESEKIEIKTSHQAIILANGQAYFGSIIEQGPEFLKLTDVYYVQNVIDNDKQVQNMLIKRGVQEWHAPDVMYVNKKHVLLVEPVTPDSRVGKLIREAKSKEKAVP